MESSVHGVMDKRSTIQSGRRLRMRCFGFSMPSTAFRLRYVNAGLELRELKAKEPRDG